MSARCAGGPVRSGTCITVRRSAPLAGSRARIHGCDLEVGHLQVGALVVSVDEVRVTDNLVRAGVRPDGGVLLANPAYRALLRPGLLRRIVPTLASPPTTNASVSFNDRTVFILTDAILAQTGEWQRAINVAQPQRITSTRALDRALLRVASTIIAARGAGPLGSARFQGVVTAMLEQDVPSAGQGVVVAGVRAADVRITANMIRDAIQGIHVGVGGPAPTSAGVVLVADNTIRVSLPTTATRDRHAIFAGSCESLVVSRNRVTLARVQRTLGTAVEAIRVSGVLGQRVVVRENHIGPQFAVGVSFGALNVPLRRTRCGSSPRTSWSRRRRSSCSRAAAGGRARRSRARLPARARARQQPRLIGREHGRTISFTGDYW